MNILVLADAGYWSYQNYLVMIKHPCQFLCSTRHEREVFLTRGSPRTLLDIEDICSGNYHSCQAVLAACGDWLFRYMFSENVIPSPETITKKNYGNKNGTDLHEKKIFPEKHYYRTGFWLD
jgi:hypothetical protein